MPKMTHPYDRQHKVDVADEKVAVYQGQGWTLYAENEPAPSPAVTRAALSEGAPVKKAAAKRTAKKRTADEA